MDEDFGMFLLVIIFTGCIVWGLTTLYDKNQNLEVRAPLKPDAIKIEEKNGIKDTTYIYYDVLMKK